MKRRRYPLSKTQRRILSNAARHPEGWWVAWPHEASAHALANRGLVEVGGYDMVELWITPAGRRALSRGWR